MLKKDDVDNVIIQADYMSGDRYTIASALHLNKKLGIVILTTEGYDKGGRDLEEFYKSASSPERVQLVRLTLPNGATAEHAKENVRGAYKEFKEWKYKENNPGSAPSAPAWLGHCVEKDVTSQVATYGTKEIAMQFGSMETDPAARRQLQNKSREELRIAWRLKDPQQQAKVEDWLTKKGFRSDRSYVFLYAKEGGRNAEKAHHFTSISTLHTLKERIGSDTKAIPVAIGDDIGVHTNPSMVKFWEDPGWKEIFEGTTENPVTKPIDSRTAQLGMWCHIAEHFTNVSVVGMRSGVMEVPALLGVRTLYLEEKHNQQANRMEQWHGPIPELERLELNVPPGIKQQEYWRKQSLKAPDTEKVHQHAKDEGDHLAGIVRGFKLNPTGQQAPKQEWSELQTNHLTKTLNLTSDQQNEIKRILEEHERERQEVEREHDHQEESTSQNNIEKKVKILRNLRIKTNNGILGQLNDEQKQRYEPLGSGMDPVNLQLNHLTKTLNLTSDQQKTIKSFLGKYQQTHQKVSQNDNTTKAILDSLGRTVDNRILGQLNDEQKQKYEPVKPTFGSSGLAPVSLQVDHLTKTLNLTSHEQGEIKAILEEHERQKESISKNDDPRKAQNLHNLRVETNNRILDQLDNQQKQKYEPLKLTSPSGAPVIPASKFALPDDEIKRIIEWTNKNSAQRTGNSPQTRNNLPQQRSQITSQQPRRDTRQQGPSRQGLSKGRSKPGPSIGPGF